MDKDLKIGYKCSICDGVFPENEIYIVEHERIPYNMQKGTKVYCDKCWNKYKNIITDTARHIYTRR